MSPVLKNRPIIMRKVIATSFVLTGDIVFALGGMADSLDQWTRSDASSATTTATSAAVAAAAREGQPPPANNSDSNNPFGTTNIDTNDLASKALQQFDQRTQDDNTIPRSIIAEFIRRDFSFHKVPLSDGARTLLSDKALRELYERQCQSAGIDPDAPPGDGAMGDSNSGWKE
jgi:hypothetical protein